MPEPSQRASTPPTCTSLPSPPDSSEKTAARLPSGVVEALEFVRSYNCGYPLEGAKWIKIHLRKGDYAILRAQLVEDGLDKLVEGKIR
jgi:hypothetical protein